MNTAFELASVAGAFGIAWLFWKFIEPKFRAAKKDGNQRTQLWIIWSVVGVFIVGIYIAARILIWMG